MTQNTNFIRKIAYGCAIVLLLFPLFLLGQPATRPSSGDDGTTAQGATGGKLAQMRSSYGLSQAELGRIDPASETMKMATLGLRGVATNLLWTKANRYKRTESWDKLSATLNQIAKLQPNYITVWEFQAHNLSYNVSVEFDDYRHRYHWVKKGIEFLIEGTRYNQRNPRLFWNLGWFVAHKIGISDEQKQFRELYREDTDFHNTMREYVNIDQARGPDGLPDNWLTAYLWYLQSEAVVEKGIPVTWMRVDVNDEGYTDKRRSAVLFYADPAMALIGSATAATKDFTPGEKTRDAWRKAGDEWNRFGSLDIPTSWGHTIRLNSLPQYLDEAAALGAELDELLPGLRDKMRTERIDTLTPEELAAWKSEKSEDQLTESEFYARNRAIYRLNVNDEDLAEEAPDDLRPKARYIAKRSMRARRYAERTISYRQQVNFDYWKTRCEVEKSKTTADARLFMRQADELALKGDPEGAQSLYEKAWQEWAQIFGDYPELIDDDMAVELYDVIRRYQLVLDQLDEEFPSDFKLQMLLDAKESDQ